MVVIELGCEAPQAIQRASVVVLGPGGTQLMLACLICVGGRASVGTRVRALTSIPQDIYSLEASGMR